MTHRVIIKALPLLALLIFSTIAFFLWTDQTSNDLERISRVTEGSADLIQTRIEGLMGARMASLRIMAERWVERMPPDFSKARFLQFAEAIYTSYPGFKGINWIDPSGTIQWAFPFKTNATAIGKNVLQHTDSKFGEAFSTAKEGFDFTSTACVELYQGGLGFNTFWPLVHEGTIQGYLDGVFEVELIIDTCLTKETLKSFWISLYEDEKLIYTNMNAFVDPANGDKRKLAVFRKISFPGKTWRLKLNPKPSIYPSADIRNLKFLILSLFFSIALSFLLHLFILRMQMVRDARDQALLEVNERKLAEKALRNSENRFRDLVINSHTAISIIQDDQVIYQNPEQERLLGPLPRATKFTDIKSIHPEDVEKVKQLYESLVHGETKTSETDFRFYTQVDDDSHRDMKWVNCRASLVEIQGKEAILVNMMDITRIKELEHLLRIQDKMTSLGRVAAGIAHEIRNPLSGINIYLNTLERIYDRNESHDKVRGILEQIQSASRKIESVIKRVMDFSKPSAPRLILAKINTPIEEAVSLSSVTLRKRGIKIEKRLDESIPPSYIDPQLMEQVILNLITNAAESMKTTEKEKTIEVVSSVENTCIIVRVSDSGPGVPDSVADKIFDPFYSTKEGSTGIGLSLCYRITKDHGGTLSLEKSKWGGAQFTIHIPL